MEIRHFTHEQHPLVLREDKIINIDQFRCGICYHFILAAPFYACTICEYYVHESCTKLPEKIDHSLHPSHPLTLRINRFFWCPNCQQLCENAPTFICDECHFWFDVDCAMTTNSIAPSITIQHVSHPHALLLVDANDYKDSEIECTACKRSESSSSGGGFYYYGCARCKYFLHDSCVDQLPNEIQHSLHPQHGHLALLWRLHFSCKLCQMVDSCAFTFECRQCGFQLCVNCGTSNRRATIKYKDHDHLLCFIEEKSTKHVQCNNADTSYCKQPAFFYSNEYNHTSRFMLHCFDCDFKVHLLCGPLPSIIKHECHIDPLILVDLLVEESSEEYYCDVCETKRDPRFRIYYCEGCKYVAHIYCVTFEIIKVLTGDLRGVDLKIRGEDLWKLPQENDNNERHLLEEEQHQSTLTLKDLIHELTKEEQRILRAFYKWDDISSKDKGEQAEEFSPGVIAQFELGDEDMNEILELSHFSYEDYDKFWDNLHKFYMETKLELKSDDLALKTANVHGYTIPYTLAPIMKTLLLKYGDISNGSPRTQRIKSISFFILCQVVKRMSSTRVIDITKKLLQEWYYHIYFVRDMKFQIAFALAHIRKLMRAFLGFQANRLEDEIPKKLKKKIAELQEGLKKCEEYCGSSSKSEFLNKCLMKASKLKWKDAGEGLLK